MAGSLNRMQMIGNLGRDPEIRQTTNGDKIANLSVACSEQWNDRNTGEKREKTEWIRVAIFGKLAEVAEKYLRKGSRVFLEGKLETRKFQDQSGQDRYMTEVVLRGFEGKMLMLDGPNGQQQSSQQASGQASDRPAPGGSDDFDDDLPF